MLSAVIRRVALKWVFLRHAKALWRDRRGTKHLATLCYCEVVPDDLYLHGTDGLTFNDDHVVLLPRLGLRPLPGQGSGHQHQHQPRRPPHRG